MFLQIAMGQLAVTKVLRECAYHNDNLGSYHSDLTKTAQKSLQLFLVFKVWMFYYFRAAAHYYSCMLSFKTE